MSAPIDGASRGQIDAKFAARIAQLEDRAGQMAATFRYMGDARPWHTPDELKEKEMMDVPGMHSPSWDRNDINRIYSADVLGGSNKDGGTTGDLIAMKWQADFMAVEERAWRMRHASYPRCMAFMHGRLDGHSQADKSVFSVVKNGVASYIRAGRGS